MSGVGSKLDNSFAVQTGHLYKSYTIYICLIATDFLKCATAAATDSPRFKRHTSNFIELHPDSTVQACY